MSKLFRPPQVFGALLVGLCFVLLIPQAAAEPLIPSLHRSLPMATVTVPTVQATPAAATPVPRSVPSPAATPAPTPPIFAAVSQVQSEAFPLTIAYVTTADEGGAPLGDLGPANFQLFEDGLPVSQFEVTSTVNTQEPLAVALVLDISGSMDGKSLAYAKQAATSFLDVLGPRDAVALVSFSNVVKVNQPFTTTKPIVARGIDNLRAGGDTALFDAVVTAIQTLAQLGPGRKVVVLLTDGEDTASKTRFEDAMGIVAAKRVPVFTVALGSEAAQKVVERIAKESGGSSIFAPSALDLASSYRMLADQLRSQYVVSFASSLPADGNEHKLVVRLNRGASGAEGQGTFVARQNPPWIDIVTPKSGQVITATQRVEATVQASSPAATIAKVEFAVDGRGIAAAAAPPFSMTLAAADFPAGQHVLRVTALDSAGNTAHQEVGFTAAAPAPTPQPTATPLPEPTATPVPLPPPPEPASPLPVIIAGGAFLMIAGIAGGLFAMRRRRAASTCPRCGTVYEGREACPTCALEERRWLLHRLREISDTDPRDKKG